MGRTQGTAEPMMASQCQSEFYVVLEGSFVYRKTNKGCFGFKNKYLIYKSNKLKI